MTTDQIQKAIDAIRECKEYEFACTFSGTADVPLRKARVDELNRTLLLLYVMLKEAARR